MAFEEFGHQLHVVCSVLACMCYSVFRSPLKLNLFAAVDVVPDSVLGVSILLLPMLRFSECLLVVSVIISQRSCAFHSCFSLIDFHLSSNLWDLPFS